MRRWLLTLIVTAIAVGDARGRVGGAAAAPSSAPDTLGLTVPAGSRRDGDRFVAQRGFAATVEHYRRELSRRGAAHELIGPYRRRGVDVARFLSLDPASRWLAVHVYRHDGKTWIFLVKRPASSSPRALDAVPRTE